MAAAYQDLAAILLEEVVARAKTSSKGGSYRRESLVVTQEDSAADNLLRWLGGFGVGGSGQPNVCQTFQNRGHGRGAGASYRGSYQRPKPYSFSEEERQQKFQDNKSVMLFMIQF